MLLRRGEERRVEDVSEGVGMLLGKWWVGRRSLFRGCVAIGEAEI